MTRTFCIQTTHILNGARRGRDLMVVVLKLSMQSVSITTKIVSSKPDRGLVHSIQHYGIILSGRRFSPSTPFSAPIKLITQCSLDIVESGVRRRIPTHITFLMHIYHLYPVYKLLIKI
jgi:hypothetical protein